jgi:hypothetical protein
MICLIGCTSILSTYTAAPRCVRLANDDTARGATIRRLEDLIQICTAVSSSFTGPAKLPFFKVLINLYKMLGALSKEVCLNRECLCCSVL